MESLKERRYIVLHHSQTEDGKTVSWDDIYRFHTEVRGWRDIGYHFGIELVESRYQVLVGRMMSEKGAHCVEGLMNRYSLGVCLVGNFDLAPPPVAQSNLAVRFVASLCTVFNIPVSHVMGHREAGSSKTCPGEKFNLDRFRAGVTAVLGVTNG